MIPWYTSLDGHQRCLLSCASSVKCCLSSAFKDAQNHFLPTRRLRQANKEQQRPSPIPLNPYAKATPAGTTRYLIASAHFLQLLLFSSPQPLVKHQWFNTLVSELERQQQCRWEGEMRLFPLWPFSSGTFPAPRNILSLLMPLGTTISMFCGRWTSEFLPSYDQFP